MKIEPVTDNKISLEGLITFRNQYKRKQFQKTKSLAFSSALLNDTDIHRDNDETFDKRCPTRKN